MDKIIVYVDDPAHALQQLAPMKFSTKPATTWVIVACPPRLAQHVSKWVNHSAREKWRVTWSDKLFDQIASGFVDRSDTVVRVIARGRLAALSDQLLAQHPSARILDARCPRFGQDLEPVVQGQPVSHRSRWSVPATMAGVGAVMVLATE